MLANIGRSTVFPISNFHNHKAYKETGQHGPFKRAKQISRNGTYEIPTLDFKDRLWIECLKYAQRVRETHSFNQAEEIVRKLEDR